MGVGVGVGGWVILARIYADPSPTHTATHTHTTSQTNHVAPGNKEKQTTTPAKKKGAPAKVGVCVSSTRRARQPTIRAKLLDFRTFASAASLGVPHPIAPPKLRFGKSQTYLLL